MTYTLDISLSLGTGKAGLSDLRAQFVDSAGAAVGSAISTGFVEIGSGCYLWHCTAIPDGHRGGVKFYSAATPATILAFGAINPEEAENAGTAELTLAAIKAKTDLLVTGTVTLTSPVTVSGDVTIDQGYDYYAADGRSLSWTDAASATWPDLSGATATLRVDHLEIVGSITNPTGPATITVELSRAETATLAVGVHRFLIDVELANTHLVLQIRGNMIVS